MTHRGFTTRTHSSRLGSPKTDANRYGDLRLLGLTVAILLVCLLILVLRPAKSSQQASVPASEAAKVLSPPASEADQTAFDTQTPDGTLADAGGWTYSPTASLPTVEEQEQALRDMAEQMAPNDVIIY